MRNTVNARAVQLKEAVTVAWHSMPGSWLGFPIQDNYVFHPSKIDELLLDSSGEDKTLTCALAGHCKSLLRRNTHSGNFHDIQENAWRISKKID